jgi:TfoX/Sxy family transcriptional regulator of competence genes
MPYDTKLAKRIQDQVGKLKGISPREMFGGVAWLNDGKMFVGIVKDELMVRIGKERHAELLKRPGARPMDFAGRPMAGYLYISQGALKTAKDLKFWIDTCLAHVKTLPAKKK